MEKRLETVDATRRERNAMAREITEDSSRFPVLLEIALNRNDELGSRACWIVEFVCKKDLAILAPNLKRFLEGLPGLDQESSIRPMAKICELISETDAKNQVNRPIALDPTQRERLIEICFDWLIGHHKVATKAYSMRSLYLLGRETPWVMENLKAVLLQNYAEGSPAYKARARQILESMEKSR